MPAKTRWSEARPGELIMDYIRWFGKLFLNQLFYLLLIFISNLILYIFYYLINIFTISFFTDILPIFLVVIFIIES